MPKKQMMAIIISAALLAVAAGLGLGIKSFLTADEIIVGVSIDGIDVGGLSTVEAEAALRDLAKGKDETRLQLGLGERIITVRQRDLGIEADLEQTITAAVRLGRSGNFWRQLQQRRRLKKEGYLLPLEFRIDEDCLGDFLARLAEEINEPAQDAYFVLGPDGKAKLVPEQVGQVLETDKARSQIVAAVTGGIHEIGLPIRRLRPRSADQVEAMGVKEVLGIFSTYFDPEAVDRNHNIRLGVAAVNGCLIKAGETFSFNDLVGPREQQQGYREAPVIIDDKLVAGIGGGICQLSTTLYNAVLLSGLEVVERQNHSLPCGYVDLGRDATLAYGAIDFKFKNSRPEAVMICAHISANQLTVAILGTNRGEQVQIETKVDEEIPFPVIYEENPDLPPGAAAVAEEGKMGYKVTVTRTIRKNNELLLHEVIARDFYRPQPEIRVVGPVKEEF